MTLSTFHSLWEIKCSCLQTLTVDWPWIPRICLNLQPFTSKGYVSIWMINSREGQKLTTNNHHLSVFIQLKLINGFFKKKNDIFFIYSFILFLKYLVLLYTVSVQHEIHTVLVVMPGNIRSSPTFWHIVVCTRNFSAPGALNTVDQSTVKCMNQIQITFS